MIRKIGRKKKELCNIHTHLDFVPGKENCNIDIVLSTHLSVCLSVCLPARKDSSRYWQYHVISYHIKSKVNKYFCLILYNNNDDDDEDDEYILCDNIEIL